MTIIELLEKYKLPKCRGDKNFIYFINDFLNEYLKDLEYIKPQLNGINEIKICDPLLKKGDTLGEYISKNTSHIDDEYLKKLYSNIKNNIGLANDLAKEIVKSLEDYFSGNVANAYQILEEAVNKYLDRLTGSLESLESGINYSIMTLGRSGNIFFRIRSCNQGELYNKKQMYHIPFSKRYLVRRQRYSIEGYPCLYLGKSGKICWCECNKPKDFNLIALKLKNDLMVKKFLLFYIEPSSLARDLKLSPVTDSNKFEKFIINYMITYPIVAAASMVRSDVTSEFIPEYIVPNLILQYLKNNESELGGILYFTCKTGIDGLKQNENINLVIPTIWDKHSNEDYDYKLINKIQFSEVKSVSLNNYCVDVPPELFGEIEDKICQCFKDE
ncbi:MAG: hypothetical protein Q8936_19555 [Bacillota bacterium]|nr:hypothetical protein [Bacillota bacterium]